MTASGRPPSSSSKSTVTMVAPSALNVYKKIAVIRSKEDTLQYEVDGTVKTVSVQELGDAIATATPLVVPRPKLEIPVPHLTINETYRRDIAANYELPRSYVRYHRVTTDEFMDRLDYVADLEDEQWLQNNPKFGEVAARQEPSSSTADGGTMDDSEKEKVQASTSHRRRTPRLSLHLFETMLDVLEKKTGFESIVTIQQAEQLILAKIPFLKYIFPTQVPKPQPPGSSVPSITTRIVIQDVYHYWVQKRSKLKRPLLRNYWPVTSTEDTNPHLVFRPREKEKYRLRKKRQNDLDAYQKLQQLHNDFDSLRSVLASVQRREELKRTQTQLQVDLFEQRLYDLVDTSGDLRLSKSSKLSVKRELDEAALMEIQSRKIKRARTSAVAGRALETSAAGLGRGTTLGMRQGALDTSGHDGKAQNIAGRNFGLPAPNFLQPLATRESYVTSWESTFPNVATYVDSHLQMTAHFRERPRIGRGGRLCIDRIPVPADPSSEPQTITTVGKGLPNYADAQQTLLDLFPEPLNQDLISHQIEKLCVAAVKDEVDRAGQTAAMDQDENDGQEVIVNARQWLDTDEQQWGEERYAIFLR